MAMVARVTSSLATVRLDATSTGNGAPAPENRNPPAAAWPLISVSRPSWVVRTESNVRKECRTKPDSPCVICRGSGRIDCCMCDGRGRTNYTKSTTLPKGEWPKWCRACRGSGLECCYRCLGTGEYRDTIGFKFMKNSADNVQDNERHRARQARRHSLPFSEIFYDDQLDSGNEK